MTSPLDPSPPPGSSASETDTGLAPNVASLLCYLLGFVSAIVFLVLEQRNTEVRFHAYQSLATFLGLFVASIVASILPLIGWLIGALITPLGVVLWVVLMVKAAQGERFKLPWVGDWAEQQVAAA